MALESPCLVEVEATSEDLRREISGLSHSVPLNLATRGYPRQQANAPQGPSNKFGGTLGLYLGSSCHVFG